MNKFKLLAVAASALFAAPAFAQDAAPVLNIEQGTVMTSTGGEFVTAASGKTLAPGERVMVSEGGSASIVYADGCSYQYGAPGVYAVQPTCVPGAAGQTGTATAGGAAATDFAALGIVAGTVALGAVGLDQMDDESDFEPAPISR